MSNAEISSQNTVFGHPSGLYTLFFAEMWERFSYYGMRALLLFYMLKGFLGYGDDQAYTVYGAYTALVYMTPFIGGLIADRVLGKRIAVVIGGTLMAAGHLLMMFESEWPFFLALALLIVGNGFFKPNISATVGSLYAPGDRKRDDGFNIFYTGINLGAAISPLLCGYVGETYGWHLGFGLATIGMLIGLAIFVMPTLLTQVLIFSGAAAATFGMLYFRPDNVYAISINVFVAACLMIAAYVACTALSRGGLPAWAGGRPEGVTGRNDWKVYLGIAVSVPIFALLVSGFSPLLSPPEDAKLTTKEQLLTERIEFLNQFGVDDATMEQVRTAGIVEEPKLRGRTMELIGKDFINSVKGNIDPKIATNFAAALTQQSAEALKEKSFETLGVDDTAKQSLIKSVAAEYDVDLSKLLAESAEVETWPEVIEAVNAKKETLPRALAGIFFSEISKPAGLVLTVLGLLAFGYLISQTLILPRVPRQRMIAAMVLIFFQMLFFAFFEQAGSSVNNFTDRNVDRVSETGTIGADQVGQEIELEPTQAQLGYTFDANDKPFTIKDLDRIRKIEKEIPGIDKIRIQWNVDAADVGMGVASYQKELPASIFQAFNAIFILIFALLFNRLWEWLRGRGADPNAAVKFAFGLIQLGLGFGAFWMGAQNASAVGMVAITWLTLGILLQTTGELCLSPVGLSTMTKLSPKVLVSTLMGSWFLATAFSQYLAGIISKFTSVGGHGSGGGNQASPIDTVNVYGDVFGQIAIAAIICGLVCLFLSPLINYWMHADDTTEY